FVFFFSSRRRHTRFSRDWSSDVCSSDLASSPRPGRLLAKALPCCRRLLLWRLQESTAVLRPRWSSGGITSSESCLFRSPPTPIRSEEHTSELQSRANLVCRLMLEKKKRK